DRRVCDLEPGGAAVDQDHRGKPDPLEKGARRPKSSRLRRGSTTCYGAPAAAGALLCSTSGRRHSPPSFPGIARRKTRANALMTRQSIFLNEVLLFDGCPGQARA